MNIVGLDRVLTDPSSHHYYFSVGASCLKAIDDDEFSLTSVGPGTAGHYALDPGSYTGAIFDDQECLQNPVVQDVPIEISVGGQSVMFVFAPKDGDLRSIVVPLEPTTAL